MVDSVNCMSRSTSLLLSISLPLQGAEAALVDFCWIPLDVQSLSIGPEGGELCLQPLASAIKGREEEMILLKVPPKAISPSEIVEVHSAIIPNGPFSLPEGYQLGSLVVYIYYDSRRVTCPLTLRLPHWYGGSDHKQDGLSFAMAPHMLKKGESEYHFKSLEGARRRQISTQLQHQNTQSLAG